MTCESPFEGTSSWTRSHTIPGRLLRRVDDPLRPELDLLLVVTGKRRELGLIRILIVRVPPVVPYGRKVRFPRRIYQMELDGIRMRCPRATVPNLGSVNHLSCLLQRHEYRLLVQVGNHPRRQLCRHDPLCMHQRLPRRGPLTLALVDRHDDVHTPFTNPSSGPLSEMYAFLKSDLR